MERARPPTSAVRSETGSSPPESTRARSARRGGSRERVPVPIRRRCVPTATHSAVRRVCLRSDGEWIVSPQKDGGMGLIRPDGSERHTISIDLHSVPSRGGRNGHPTDRCSCCSSGTVGRPTSTRFDQMVPVSSRSRIRPTSTRPTPTRVRGRASKEPRRVGAGYRRPTGRTPRHGRARLSRHRTRIQGEVGMMRLGSARDWGRAPPPLDDVMIAGRRRDPSVSVTLRLAHAPPTHVLLLISHRE